MPAFSGISHWNLLGGQYLSQPWLIETNSVTNPDKGCLLVIGSMLLRVAGFSFFQFVATSRADYENLQTVILYGGTLGGNILITLCMLGNFSCFCCRLLTFFKISFCEKKFGNTTRVSNGLDPDQDESFVSYDLGPSHLQRLSADDKRLLLLRKERILHSLCINQ